MLNCLGRAARKNKKPFNDLLQKAHLLGYFSVANVLKGNVSKARWICENQVSILLKEENLAEIIRGKISLANIQILSGDLQKAQRLSMEVIQLGRRSFNLSAIGWGQILMGMCRGIVGQETESLSYMKKGIAFVASSSRNRDERELVMMLQSLIDAYDLSEIPISIREQKKGLFSLIYSIAQGNFYLDQEDFENARSTLLDAISQSKIMELSLFELISLDSYAELLLTEGKFAECYHLLAKLESYSTVSQIPMFHAGILNKLAIIENEQGNKNLAINYAQKAYIVSAGSGKPYIFSYEQSRANDIIDKLGGALPILPDKRNREEVLINPSDKDLFAL